MLAQLMTPNRLLEDWLEGRKSLGTACGWTAEEMRLVADIGYALAEQGRHDEAVTIFEGLAVLAPATAYFQAALGALWLRKGEPERALEHLEAALAADPGDVTARVNRGEAAMQLGDAEAARRHLLAALELGPRAPQAADAPALIRARALLAQLPS
jgi:tetratricopeptide (TPR) repeat protein